MRAPDRAGKFVNVAGRQRRRYCQPSDAVSRKPRINAVTRFVLLQPRMTTTLSDVEELTEKIIGCAIEVHRVLGPGLLESVYRDCLIIELRREGLRVESERYLHFDYKGQRIRGALKLDLISQRLHRRGVESGRVPASHSLRAGDHLPEDQRVSRRTSHELQFDDS
jgi:hypothetical protein